MDINNYLNTLIFIIIAKGFTICLLILLIFEFGKQYSYVILMFQLGIFVIVIWAILKIINYDKARDKLKKQLDNAPPYIATCPEYHVLHHDSNNGNKICRNTYVTPNGKTTYEFTNTDANISDILRDKKKMSDICDKNSDFINYPWTELKSKCESL